MTLNTLLPPRHLLIILLLSVALMAPAFILGAGGQDLHCQSLWIKFFSRQFWDGELYPRWLLDMFVGRGSPVFFFYPPLAYFITAFFFFLSPLADFGYFQIAAACWLAVFLSGITFYLWIKSETHDHAAALAASLLYMTFPDHININFYSYLMPSTMWVYVWLPLLFLTAKQMLQQRSSSIVPFSIMLGILMLTNIPQTALWSIISISYCITHLNRHDARWQAPRLVMAIALGAGLAAFYLVPLLAYKNFVTASSQFNTIQLGNAVFDKEQFIFFFNTALSANILLSCFFVLSVALLALCYIKSSKSHERTFFVTVCFLALFCMLPVTLPLWRLLPIYLIQFSERLFVISSLCLAYLCALTFPKLRPYWYGLIVVFTVLTFVWPQLSRTSIEQFKIADPLNYRQYSVNIEQYQDYFTSLDLIPLYKGSDYKRDASNKLILQPLAVETYADKFYVVPTDTKVTVKEWKPRNILLHYQAATDARLILRQFMFPGFRAFTANRELELNRDPHTGQIIMHIPAGEGDIHVQLTALMPEMMGKAISLFSAGIMLLLLLLQLHRRNKMNQVLAKN